MSTNLEDAYKLIGTIKCISAEDMNDGTMKVVFDYDQKFKDEYKRIFKLKRFSKKHFENLLEQAIKHFAEQVKADKELLNLKEEVLKLKED